jgi:hypothetical protein
MVLFPFLLLAALCSKTVGQFNSNQCPPVNFGVAVPSLCEGDATDLFANVTKTHPVCFPTNHPAFRFKI